MGDSKLTLLLAVIFCSRYCSCENAGDFLQQFETDSATSLYDALDGLVTSLSSVLEGRQDNSSDEVVGQMPENASSEERIGDIKDKGETGQQAGVTTTDATETTREEYGYPNGNGQNRTELADETPMDTKHQFMMFRFFLAKQRRLKYLTDQFLTSPTGNESNEQKGTRLDTGKQNTHVRSRQQVAKRLTNLLTTLEIAKRRIEKSRANTHASSQSKDIAYSQTKSDNLRICGTSAEKIPKTKSNGKEVFDVAKSNEIYNLLAKQAKLDIDAVQMATTKPIVSEKLKNEPLKTQKEGSSEERRKQETGAVKESKEAATAKESNAIPIAKRFKWFLKRYEYFDNIASSLVG